MKHAFLHRAAGMMAATALFFSTPAARGDDLTTVLQYELSLGGGQAVSTLYFAYQPDGASGVASFDMDGAPAALRLPVYSTDPGRQTMLSQLSVSMRMAGSGEATFGDFAGALVGLALAGGAAYAFLKDVEDAFEVDLSGIDYPGTPESGAQPTASAGHANP